MRAVVALVAVFATGIASAEPQPWMKKKDPNELGYYFIQEIFSCQLNVPAGLIADILTRSRIKALDYFAMEAQATMDRIMRLPAESRTPHPSQHAAIFLDVHVNCAALPNDRYAVAMRINWARWDGQNRMLYANPDYSSVGYGPPEFVIQGLKDRIESAITDYLKANFDL